MSRISLYVNTLLKKLRPGIRVALPHVVGERGPPQAPERSGHDERDVDPEKTIDARGPSWHRGAVRLARLRPGGPGQMVESGARYPGRPRHPGRPRCPRPTRWPRRSQREALHGGLGCLPCAGVARSRGLPARAAIFATLAGASYLSRAHVAALGLGLSRPAGLRVEVLQRAVLLLSPAHHLRASRPVLHLGENRRRTCPRGRLRRLRRPLRHLRLQLL